MVDTIKLGEMEGTYAEKVKQSVQELGKEDIGENRSRARAIRGEASYWDGEGAGSRPWEEDPAWLCLPHLQEEERDRNESMSGALGTEEGISNRAATQVQKGGHWLKCTGNLVWCTRCACFAHKRFGVGLKDVCKPVKRGARSVRLARLHTGCHPITGKPMKDKA